MRTYESSLSNTLPLTNNCSTKHNSHADACAICFLWQVRGPFKCGITISSVLNTKSWWYMSCRPCKKSAEQQVDRTYRCPKWRGSDTVPRYWLVQQPHYYAYIYSCFLVPSSYRHTCYHDTITTPVLQMWQIHIDLHRKRWNRRGTVLCIWRRGSANDPEGLRIHHGISKRSRWLASGDTKHHHQEICFVSGSF